MDYYTRTENHTYVTNHHQNSHWPETCAWPGIILDLHFSKNIFLIVNLTVTIFKMLWRGSQSTDELLLVSYVHPGANEREQWANQTPLRTRWANVVMIAPLREPWANKSSFKGTVNCPASLSLPQRSFPTGPLIQKILFSIKWIMRSPQFLWNQYYRWWWLIGNSLVNRRAWHFYD